MSEAELRDGTVVVTNGPTANRLQDKGGFGDRTGDGLVLDLHEALHLVSEGRLTVTDPDGAPVTDAALLELGAERTPHFTVRHVAYDDTRNRGFVVRDTGDHFEVMPRGARPDRTPPTAHLHAVADHAPMSSARIDEALATARRAGCTTWLAVVDEDADVTYYELELARLDGDVEPITDAAGVALRVLSERVLVVDGHDEVDWLQLGGRVGDARVLSVAEALHLVERGASVEPDRDALVEAGARHQGDAAGVAALYDRLREAGCLPKTGLKFGVHFRVYTTRMGDEHAPYLAQHWGADWTGAARDVARLVRLAHSVRKELLVATGSNIVRIEWVRP